MKKTLLLLLSCGLFSSLLYGQSVLEYRFSGDFKEVNNAGPELIQLCTGNFVEETLPDYNITRTVYQFDNNCGFYFDDSLTGFIASESYTIELYFSMEQLNSWKRVIDFKSRTADRGCYVYNGQLNFYNIATSSSDAPFAANTYSHYVITRDAATKHVMMYGDGDKFIQFTDNNDDAVYDDNKKLRFFQDDLAVQNEASAGSIALLRIYNHALDSVTVKNTYNVLSGTILSAGKAIASPEFSIHPNPVRDAAVFTLPGGDVYRYTIADISGRILTRGEVSAAQNHVDMSMLPEGVYTIRLQDRNGMSAVRKLVRY